MLFLIQCVFYNNVLNYSYNAVLKEQHFFIIFPGLYQAFLLYYLIYIIKMWTFSPKWYNKYMFVQEYQVNFNCLCPQFFNTIKKEFCSDIIKNYILSLNKYNDCIDYLNSNHFVFVKCNKCSLCLNSKVNCLNNKVISHIKQHRYNYFLTLTFSNNKIKTNYNFLRINKDYEQINTNLFTSVSKIQISNIIRNLKKKFNNYYKKNVQFNYFLSAEYGKRTDRAHYHIYFSTSEPIPKLRQINNKYYVSSFLDSKQYSNYNVQIVNSNNPKVGYYLTKYISKDLYYKNSSKYSNMNIETERLILKEFGFFIKSQSPFIKKSRQLGITGDLKYDIKNGVLSKYLYNKYIYKLCSNSYLSFVQDKLNYGSFKYIKKYDNNFLTLFNSFNDDSLNKNGINYFNNVNDFETGIYRIANFIKSSTLYKFIRYFKNTKYLFLYKFLCKYCSELIKFFEYLSYENKYKLFGFANKFEHLKRIYINNDKFDKFDFY